MTCHEAIYHGVSIGMTIGQFWGAGIVFFVQWLCRRLGE